MGPLYSWSLAEIRVDDRTLPDDHGPICTLDHESDDSHRPGSIKDGFRNLGGTRSHHRGKRNVIPSLCLPPGKHNLSGTVLVEVGNRYIAREIEFDQTVDVLADHSALMMRVDDPELADQIRDSAVPTVRLVAMGRNTAELELEFEAWRIEPAIICGEIQVVVDGRLLDYTSFGSGDLVTRDFMPRSRGGSGTRSHHTLTLHGVSVAPASVTIVIEPRPELIIDQLNPVEIGSPLRVWSRPIRYEDVPVVNALDQGPSDMPRPIG
jgi:hypothetical protein